MLALIGTVCTYHVYTKIGGFCVGGVCVLNGDDDDDVNFATDVIPTCISARCPVCACVGVRACVHLCMRALYVPCILCKEERG